MGHSHPLQIRLLGEYPDMCVVIVAADASRAFLYNVQPQLTVLEPEEGSLAAAIRLAVTQM